MKQSGKLRDSSLHDTVEGKLHDSALEETVREITWQLSSRIVREITWQLSTWHSQGNYVIALFITQSGNYVTALFMTQLKGNDATTLFVTQLGNYMTWQLASWHSQETYVITLFMTQSGNFVTVLLIKQSGKLRDSSLHDTVRELTWQLSSWHSQGNYVTTLFMTQSGKLRDSSLHNRVTEITWQLSSWHNQWKVPLVNMWSVLHAVSQSSLYKESGTLWMIYKFIHTKVMSLTIKVALGICMNLISALVRT